MAQLPTKEGTISFEIPSIHTACFTYYKIIGDVHNGSPPVVVVHGGPGTGHEYLLPFANLWSLYGLPVVFYDQIGCGSSTRLPQTAGDNSFWQESLFIAELDNLLDKLRLRDGPGFHLLGQSWGGMIGAAFAAGRPRGLRRLVLASALASQELSIRGIQLLRMQLPPETQQALKEAEKKGEFDSQAFTDGVGMLFKKHLCRVEPFPPEELIPALTHLSEDKTVNKTMYVTPTATVLSFTVSCFCPSPISNFSSEDGYCRALSCQALTAPLSFVWLPLYGFLCLLFFPFAPSCYNLFLLYLYPFSLLCYLFLDTFCFLCFLSLNTYLIISSFTFKCYFYIMRFLP